MRCIPFLFCALFCIPSVADLPANREMKCVPVKKKGGGKGGNINWCSMGNELTISGLLDSVN